MVSGVGCDAVVASGEWPCSVCKRGVGRNSIICCVCDEWVHKRCSGAYGTLWNVTTLSVPHAKRTQMVEPRLERIDLGDTTLECVDKFCYLGEMIGESGVPGRSSGSCYHN